MSSGLSEQGECPHPHKGKGQCLEPSLVHEAIRSILKSLGSPDRRGLVLEELKGRPAFQASVMTAGEAVRDVRAYSGGVVDSRRKPRSGPCRRPGWAPCVGASGSVALFPGGCLAAFSCPQQSPYSPESHFQCPWSHE